MCQLKTIKVQSREEGSRLAAKLFADLAEQNPDKPVGLATGSTMAGVYSALADMGFRPTCPHAFALDEYAGLPQTHENSYFRELSEKFAHATGWTGALHVPGVGYEDVEAGAEAFEETITALGPVSVQLLGLGSNGHIAFNEPGSAFDSVTRVVELHPQTRADNARFFASADQVPTNAVTQGLATINRASALLLLVFGEGKRPALLQALSDPGPMTPLAALLDHPNLTLITDLDI